MYSTVTFIAALFAASTAIAAPLENESNAGLVEKREHLNARGHRAAVGRPQRGQHAKGINRTGPAGGRHANKGVGRKGRKKGGRKNMAKRSSHHDSDSDSDSDSDDDDKHHSTSKSKSSSHHSSSKSKSSSHSSSKDSDKDSDSDKDKDSDSDDDDSSSGADADTQQAINCLSKDDAEDLLDQLKDQGATSDQINEAKKQIPALSKKGYKPPSSCPKKKRSLADLD